MNTIPRSYHYTAATTTTIISDTTYPLHQPITICSILHHSSLSTHSIQIL